MTEAESKEAAAGFFAALMALPVSTPVAFACVLGDAFVLSKLWAWHMVALGLPAVTLAQATALRLMLWVLRSSFVGRRDDRPAKERGSSFAAWLCSPWLALLLGWLLR